MDKFIYPSLVEQAYLFSKEQGILMDKAELYKHMVEEGFIDENGDATKLAIDTGLITVYEESKDMSLRDFKKNYKSFRKYPKKYFTFEAGYWYLSKTILDEFVKQMESETILEDDLADFQIYYKNRNYENPKTIEELRGVYYPLYEGVEDFDFIYTKKGEIAITNHGLIQVSKNVLSGLFPGGDKKSAQEFLNENDG